MAVTASLAERARIDVMDISLPTDDAPVGLRERRRRETLRELSDAALDLFERQGLHGTTVDDIARAAGTSPRTFFRYYATKEHAVFLDDEDSVTVVREGIEAVRRGEPVVRALETGWMRLLDDFDRRRDEHPRALRVRRLVQHEPTLLALALRRDAEHADEVAAAVAAADGGSDPLIARALVAVVGTTVRIAFDEWARLTEQGEPASVHEIYLEVRRGLSARASELGADL